MNTSKYTVAVNSLKCKKCFVCEIYLPGLLSFPYGMEFRPLAYNFIEHAIDRAIDVCPNDAIELRFTQCQS